MVYIDLLEVDVLMSVADIKIGDRARKDMGDVSALAESIKEHGLLHPIVVMDDGDLIAGGRRLAAVGLLGWAEVPVTVLNVRDLLSAERDENAIRKDLTPTEAVALGRLIAAAHRKLIEADKPAQVRKAGRASVAARGGVVSNETTCSEEPTPAPHGRSRAAAAAAVGMAESTLARATQVVEAAEEDPEKFGDLPAKMDETGSVFGTFEELKRRKEGTPARSDVHYKAQYPKPNREMERGLATLDGLVTGFGLIELDQLDREKTKEWAEQLSKAATSLNRVAKKVRGLNV